MFYVYENGRMKGWKSRHLIELFELLLLINQGQLKGTEGSVTFQLYVSNGILNLQMNWSIQVLHTGFQI